jgi:hypothetical protein
MFHSFSEELAIKYDINEAIILQDFWSTIRGKMSRDEHCFEVPGRSGVFRHWCYDTIKTIHKRHQYLSESRIRGAIDNLIEAGVLVKGNFNNSAYDRTTWYCILDEEVLEIFGCTKQNASVEKEKSICENHKMEDSETTNDTTLLLYKPIELPIISKKSSKTFFDKKTSITKEQYQVILNDPRLANGDREFLLSCVNEMADWSASNGSKKLDWPATLRNWVRRAVKDKQKFEKRPKTFAEIEEERQKEIREKLRTKYDNVIDSE